MWSSQEPWKVRAVIQLGLPDTANKQTGHAIINDLLFMWNLHGRCHFENDKKSSFLGHSTPTQPGKKELYSVVPYIGEKKGQKPSSRALWINLKSQLPIHSLPSHPSLFPTPSITCDYSQEKKNTHTHIFGKMRLWYHGYFQNFLKAHFNYSGQAIFWGFGWASPTLIGQAVGDPFSRESCSLTHITWTWPRLPLVRGQGLGNRKTDLELGN